MSNQFNIDRQLALRIVTGDFNAQQSAVAELRALLAAPVVERQADAWVDPYTIKAIACNPQSNDRFAMAAHKDERNGYTQPLYTSPPAPVAVDDQQALQDRHEAWMAGVEQGKAEAVPEGWKLVPIEPTEVMLSVLRDRVLISVNSRKQEANILNDKAWWRAVVESAPACLDKVKEMNR